MAFLLLATQFFTASAAVLRNPQKTGTQSGTIVAARLKKDGGEQSGPIVAAYLRGTSNSTASKESSSDDDRGPHGHFYYAEKCEDCVYKETQCGCQPAMEYLACVTKHCHASNSSEFGKKCQKFGSTCSAELDMDCSSSKTACEGKYHQLPSGGLGFAMQLKEDRAFCGPYGKCIGKVHMKIDLHLPSVLQMSGKITPGHAETVTPDTTLECGLQKATDAASGNKTQWNLCHKGIVSGKAVCHFELSKLSVSKGKEVYCVLTKGKDGERLTQPAWHILNNKYESEPEDKPAAPEDKPLTAPVVIGEPILPEATKDGKPPWMKGKDKI